MTRTIEVVHEHGVLRPVEPLDLPEGWQGTVFVREEVVADLAKKLHGRPFSEGIGSVLYVAPDFDEPLEEFREYM